MLHVCVHSCVHTKPIIIKCAHVLIHVCVYVHHVHTYVCIPDTVPVCDIK